jgi:hypothetical protein
MSDHSILPFDVFDCKKPMLPVPLGRSHLLCWVLLQWVLGKLREASSWALPIIFKSKTLLPNLQQEIKSPDEPDKSLPLLLWK